MDGDHPSYVAFLSSKQRLERDKGLELIEKILEDATGDDISALETNVLELLAVKKGWEGSHGALMAAALLIERRFSSEDFCMKIQQALPMMLEHDEPRVRLSAGTLAK